MAEKVEDLNLPASVVTRIIKESLPSNANVSKEARVAVAKAASIFVLYLTSTANNIATQAKRKTISGQDVLKALTESDFEQFVEVLEECLDSKCSVLNSTSFLPLYIYIYIYLNTNVCIIYNDIWCLQFVSPIISHVFSRYIF